MSPDTRDNRIFRPSAFSSSLKAEAKGYSWDYKAIIFSVWTNRAKDQVQKPDYIISGFFFQCLYIIL